MLESYLSILTESLIKKANYLRELKTLSETQNEYLKGDEPDFDRFSEIVNDKDLIIDELNKLDEGFDLTFEKIKEELVANKEQYATEIAKLQDLIREVTDMGIEIQALEARNKSIVEQAFASQRRQYKAAIQSVDVARKYSNSMHNSSVQGAQSMDFKK